MEFLGFLAVGLIAGFLLSRLLGFPPEQQTVCIMNCADGSVHRQVCISTQDKKCIDDLRTKCDAEPEPEAI